MRLTLLARDAADTLALGHALGAALLPLPEGGLVIALDGELGAGKTLLAGGIVHGLGVPSAVDVPSPTFTFARAYRGPVRILHVDAYRVAGPADLEATGFLDLVANPRGDAGVTVVEWASRIASALPTDRIEVTLSPVSPPRFPPPTGAASAGVAPPPPPSPPRPPPRPPPAAPPDDATLRRIEVEATGPASARVLGRLGQDPALRPLLDLGPTHGPTHRPSESSP